MMTGASRSGWVVAASIGAVEALKDQLGVCRWNYPLRSIMQRGKITVQSLYQSHVLPNSSSSSASSDASAGSEKMASIMRENAERREMVVKKVMDLNCWGPSTVRF